ncbi:MAG: hypothetical protein WCR42_15275 [bacterium]
MIEFYIRAVTILILIFLITFPFILIYLLKKRLKKKIFIIYIFLGLILLFIGAVAFAWWADTSNVILLKHYGYIYNGIEAQRYQNVQSKNLEMVKSLELSMMGIGWPVKVFFGFLIFSPYLIIVYPLYMLIANLRKNNRKLINESK